MTENLTITYWDLVREHPYLFDNSNAMIEIVLDPSLIEEHERRLSDEMERKGNPRAWGKHGLVFEDHIMLVIRDYVKYQDGSIRTYSRIINRADLKGGRGVVILPSLDGKVLVLEQYRHATRSWHYEIPRGFGTPGISAAENAKKELEEEINGTIESLSDLGICHNNTGMEGGFAQLFSARLSSVGETEAGEGIKRFIQLDIAKFEELIRDGTITDSFTIVAYTRAKLRGLI
jgi:ADP-ribose pyrophosphatase